MNEVEKSMRRAKWLYPTLLFFAQRTLLSVIGILLYILGYVPLTEDPVLRPYFGISPITEGISGALLGVWQRFDVIHFLRIAQSGYSQPDLSPFFPLVPLLTRWIGKMIGENYLLSSFLIANVSCLSALVAAYYWLLDEGYDKNHARITLLFLLWFPTSFFLLVPYSESLFLMFALLTLWNLRKGRWLLAGVTSMLATLTRISGVVLSAVILFEWFMVGREKRLKQTLKPLLSSMMPPIAFAGLTVWRANQNLPGLMEVQATYWHRIPSLPWVGITQTIGHIVHQDASFIEYLDLFVVIGMLLAGIAVIRKLPPTLGIYHWGLLLFSLSQIRLGQPLSGQARLSIALFPAFIILAKYAHGALMRRAVAYIFVTLNLYLAGQFILWGWVG
jgi:Gpi18-like mannosyltransferase